MGHRQRRRENPDSGEEDPPRSQDGCRGGLGLLGSRESLEPTKSFGCPLYVPVLDERDQTLPAFLRELAERQGVIS